MTPSILRNFGHFINVVPAVNGTTQFNSGALVAGAGLTITATGITIDTIRNPGATGAACAVTLKRRPYACKVVIPFISNVASGYSWTVGGLLRHCSASGGTYTTLATLNSVVQTRVGLTTTTTSVYQSCQTDVDLANLGAKRFLKVRVTVAGSATTTASLMQRGTVVVVFNADQTPATATGVRG